MSGVPVFSVIRIGIRNRFLRPLPLKVGDWQTPECMSNNNLQHDSSSHASQHRPPSTVADVPMSEDVDLWI